MGFSVKKAATKVNRVEVVFNNQRLTLKYQAGSRYKAFQKDSSKRQFEYVRLSSELERALQQDTEEDAARVEEIAAGMRQGRRDMADSICMITESWDLTGDLDEIREEYYASLSEEEMEALSDEDKQALENPTADGDRIPIEGVWLDALPLPDDFLTKILDAINADYQSGGAGKKART